MQLGVSSCVQGRVTFPGSLMCYLGLHNKLLVGVASNPPSSNIHMHVGRLSRAEIYAEQQWDSSFSQPHKRGFDSSGFLGRSED